MKRGCRYDAWRFSTPAVASTRAARRCEHPSYFPSLELLRHASAVHVRTDPRTRELDRYLQQHGIATILDAPMLRSGRVFGVVCHEHQGPQRVWNADEEKFAYLMSSFVAMAKERRR